ncbi:hypothetical protein ES708_10133 [subsurface metagenome]
MGTLLTDEELFEAIGVEWNSSHLRAIEAQLKKVVELLKACDGELVSRNEGPFMATFEMLVEDYQTLLEEAGLNKEVENEK